MTRIVRQGTGARAAPPHRDRRWLSRRWTSATRVEPRRWSAVRASLRAAAHLIDAQVGRDGMQPRAQTLARSVGCAGAVQVQPRRLGAVTGHVVATSAVQK